MVSELLFLMLAWRTYFRIQKHWTSVLLLLLFSFRLCCNYTSSPWGSVVLQMDIIKGGNKRTVTDASRSYLAVLYPLILSPTFRFQQVASYLWLCVDIAPWALLCYPRQWRYKPRTRVMGIHWIKPFYSFYLSHWHSFTQDVRWSYLKKKEHKEKLSLTESSANLKL